MNNDKQTGEDTPFDKFLAFTKRVVSVPKAEIDRREAEYKKARKIRRKRAAS
jgi:hypothetical protein